jgi:hypothetical protein
LVAIVSEVKNRLNKLVLVVQTCAKSVQNDHLSAMTKKEEEQDLKNCLALIEAQLGWGPSANWTNYDFDKLSEIFHEKTSVRLSITTLKRIWGKLKYESAPTLTTLNALARFAGYADWRVFRQAQPSYTPELELAGAEQPGAPKKAAGFAHFHYYWLLCLILLLILGYTIVAIKAPTDPLDPQLFAFRADKVVSEGVPNSVVFHYNATAAKTDSVFIVQTWDIRRKRLVSKSERAHSAIYYYPGFFHTKLIADGQVVRTHDLWITSNGWLCLAEGDPAPLYFKKNEYERNGVVEVNESVLRQYNLALHPKAPKIRFYNQRNMGDLMTDNFSFETTLKSDFNQGTNVCQPVQVLIQCKNDVIIIPLVAKSCVGDLALSFCGAEITSKAADLSGFGADLTKWTKLRIETTRKQATIFVNGQKAYSLAFPNEATGIVGVQYRFNGPGAVKDTWFKHNGRTVRL